MAEASKGGRLKGAMMFAKLGSGRIDVEHCEFGSRGK